MQSTTTHALKEWATAVDALAAGKTIMLLRKGGIKEEGKNFKVAYNRVLLYPTFEHQRPELLKADYATKVQPVESGWHPETIRIGSWAEITDIFQVSAGETVAALLPYHIWNEEFASTRLKWKPRQPLYILLLRIYKLPQLREIQYLPEYGGCKSWIDLAEDISLEGSVPVLDDANYAQKVGEISTIVREQLTNCS